LFQKKGKKGGVLATGGGRGGETAALLPIEIDEKKPPKGEKRKHVFERH